MMSTNILQENKEQFVVGRIKEQYRQFEK